MRKRKRQTVKKLIQCVAIIAAGVLAIILFMLAIWYRGKNSEPVRTVETAVLGATYVGNSYLANTF